MSAKASWTLCICRKGTTLWSIYTIMTSFQSHQPVKMTKPPSASCAQLQHVIVCSQRVAGHVLHQHVAARRADTCAPADARHQPADAGRAGGERWRQLCPRYGHVDSRTRKATCWMLLNLFQVFLYSV